MATRTEAARRHASHYLAVLERLGDRLRDDGLALDLEREWPQIRRAREWSAVVPDDAGRTPLDRGFSRLAGTALGLALARARQRTEPMHPAPAERDGADLQLALSLSRYALAISLQDGDLPEQVRDYATVGVIYYRLGELDRAAECFRRAIEVSRALPHPHGIALDLAKLAATRTQTGWLKAAYETVSEALHRDGEGTDGAGIPRPGRP